MLFHGKTAKETLEALETDVKSGLSSAQAEEKRAKYGFNRLNEKKKKSTLLRFLEQFKDVMILILIAAAIVSFTVICVEKNWGELFEPALILLIVILNAIMGVARPGDMGFDIMHINLHKTFSTPHGGGGPGSGPVGVRKGLEEYLPNPQVKRQEDGYFTLVNNPESLGSVSAFLGNYGIVIRAYAYLLSLGKEYVPMAGKLSVLNANYIKEHLKEYYKLPIDVLCKHEFVFDGLREEYGGDHHDPGHVTTLDVAKRLLDYGYHAPTIYFPLLFHEAMMIEPTETESKKTLDEFIDVMKKIAIEARDQRELLKTAPHHTPVRRLDDVKAVKEPKFTYKTL